ncbi:MAG: peptidoglycan synthetase, partial [Bacteroidota bacterium]|nr:peptidoglycan synthetase [Bacteroidota bacterium]
IPAHTIADGKTTVTINKITGALKVFGDHNLLNLHAAYYACKELKIADEEFIKAIGTFTGASKRLELIGSNASTNVYRDFAHAPSKVKATIDAVKQQYPNRKLIGILELHTYSSLNENFMSEYNGAMAKADVAVVFYSKHALELKRMPELPKEKVAAGFAKENLIVLNDKTELWNWLQHQNYSETNLVLMSSGNYDGLDMLTFAKQITS